MSQFINSMRRIFKMLKSKKTVIGDGVDHIILDENLASRSKILKKVNAIYEGDASRLLDASSSRILLYVISVRAMEEMTARGAAD